MMKIRLNGEEREVPEGISILELLDRLGVENRNLAIEHNREFLEPDHLEATRLRAGDSLEIVRFVGGG
jgi:thiamine biosynthesis protein ThiS